MALSVILRCSSLVVSTISYLFRQIRQHIGGEKGALVLLILQGSFFYRLNECGRQRNDVSFFEINKKGSQN
jgi:hypothetical protein